MANTRFPVTPRRQPRKSEALTRTHKHCHGCQRKLHVSEFGKNNRNSDGLQTRCKACTNAYAKAYFKRTQAAFRAALGHDAEAMHGDSGLTEREHANWQATVRLLGLDPRNLPQPEVVWKGRKGQEQVMAKAREASIEQGKRRAAPMPETSSSIPSATTSGRARSTLSERISRLGSRAAPVPMDNPWFVVVPSYPDSPDAPTEPGVS